jgi:putative RNA 2'-phosphotransferase
MTSFLHVKLINSTQLSRAISHALRHEPWLYELELDDEGWVEVTSLLAALRQQGSEWSNLARTDIEQMIGTSEKRRHELIGDRIRALYGHSLPGKLQRVRAEPPVTLFHGTTPEVAELILLGGLKPMGRQYVHLSTDERTAAEVGRRKSKQPILLRVRSSAAHQNGIAFYVGNENVWLADFVAPEFVERLNEQTRTAD